MLLDPETWDLVQHIDSVLAAVERRRARGPHPRRADAVGARGDDARVPHRRRRACTRSRSCAATSPRSRAREGCRFGSAGTHPFSLFERQRITARDRYRQLVDQLQYIARRELIFGMHMHVAVDDPGEGDPGDERPARAPAADARALGVVAVLARRADRALVEPADGLRRVPALRPAAALQGLRRLRGGRRPARAHRLHRRLHAHLVGHPPASAPRHDRDARLRRGHAARGRRRDHRVLPGDREDVLRAVRGGQGDPELAPPADDREQVARRALRARGADHGSRDRPPQPRARRAARSGARSRDVEPHARELGSERELEGVREILARGNGADRQLRVWNANRDIVEVVREISIATEEGALRQRTGAAA